MAGLQGVGKTTACGKLALYLRKQKKKVLMVATDVYRPAAIEQLVKLGERIKVPVFEQGTDAKPEAIAAAGVKHVSHPSWTTCLLLGCKAILPLCCKYSQETSRNAKGMSWCCQCHVLSTGCSVALDKSSQRLMIVNVFW